MFRVGQKVKCIKETPSGSVKEGRIYTVTFVGKDNNGAVGITLLEAIPAKGYERFHAWRFIDSDDSCEEEIMQKVLLERR